MKICVFGAGAIGGMLASLLKRNGADVVLIARGEHYKSIKKKGLIFLSKEYDLDICQNFEVYDNVNQVSKFDLIINGLKAHSANETARNLSSIMHKKTILLPTLNGVPWWFFYKMGGKFNNYQIQSVDPNNYQWNFLSPSSVIGAVVYPAAEIIKPGVIKHIEGKRFILGEPDNFKSERVIKISKLFIESGIKAPISKNIRSDIWLKLIGNSSFNPLSVITQSTLRQLCESKSTKQIIIKMMEEIINIGNFLNIETKLSIDKRIEGAKNVGDHKTSTLQDFEKRKPLEIDALIKVLIEIGEITRIKTPTLETVYLLTKYLAEKNNCFPS